MSELNCYSRSRRLYGYSRTIFLLPVNDARSGRSGRATQVRIKLVITTTFTALNASCVRRRWNRAADQLFALIR